MEVQLYQLDFYSQSDAFELVRDQRGYDFRKGLVGRLGV